MSEADDLGNSWSEWIEISGMPSKCLHVVLGYFPDIPPASPEKLGAKQLISYETIFKEQNKKKYSCSNKNIKKLPQKSNLLQILCSRFPDLTIASHLYYI